MTLSKQYSRPKETGIAMHNIHNNAPDAAAALRRLGAAPEDMEPLLAYTANAFSPCEDGNDDGFLERWRPVIEMAGTDGPAAAINRYLAKPTLTVAFASPETLRVEIYRSIGGDIPVITTESTADFENMVRRIVFKGKEVPHIETMGASFAFGAVNRFIILSNTPYSNVPAERMGLGEAEWQEKSMRIRKHHECAHYFTKRFYGSSRNNLHDELIADFCGLYAAFGEYRAEWFLKFLGLGPGAEGTGGRFKVYVPDLSGAAEKVAAKLAAAAAEWVEEWSRGEAFAQMDERERIGFLCSKDLCAYISNV
jgi:hypothetical protein